MEKDVPSTDMSTAEKVIDGVSGVGDAAGGAWLGTRNVQMKLNTSKVCKVNILTKTSTKTQWVARFDSAHKGTEFAHINLNPKVNTRLIVDPHLHIPGGTTTLKGIERGAKVLKKVNKVLVPLAVVADSVELGVSIGRDIVQKTSRNTVESAVSIAGGWGGGFGGAAAGAAMGSLIFPGVGTMIGGLIGGISGGVGLGIGAAKATEAISDKCGYDMWDGNSPCRECGRRYKYPKYKHNDDGYCEDCRQTRGGCIIS